MNFITEKLAKSLGRKQGKCSVPIGALDALTMTAKRYMTAMLSSINGTCERTLTFLVISAISNKIPAQPIDRLTINIPRNLRLSDPQFHIPDPIDVLLSSGPTSMYVDVRRTNQVNAGGQIRPASRKNVIRMGHRGKPQFPKHNKCIPRLHDGSTRGPCAILGN
jgi:hypothetical protein